LAPAQLISRTIATFRGKLATRITALAPTFAAIYNGKINKQVGDAGSYDFCFEEFRD
jgi:hypothetical protein